MKQFAAFAVVGFYIILTAASPPTPRAPLTGRIPESRNTTAAAKKGFKERCIRETENGNTCEISKWVCDGTKETQTLQVTLADGGSYSRKKTRTPCRPSNATGAAIRPKGRTSSKEEIVVDGEWSPWTGWSECTKTCGVGKKHQIRECDRPAPSKSGKDCVGRRNKTKACNVRDCEEMTVCTQDTHDDCEYWKTLGMCESNSPGSVRLDCCKTCNADTITMYKQTSGGKVTRRPRKNRGKGGKVTKRPRKNTRKATKRPRINNSCLKFANSFRKKHVDTPLLKWDENLAKAAKAHADALMNATLERGGRGKILKHDGSRGNVGENLYYVQKLKTGGTGLYCRLADLHWYEEGERYNYDTANSTHGKTVDHFTQMVWAESTCVGYGVATAPSPLKKGKTLAIVVARYQPPGNFHILGSVRAHTHPDIHERRLEDYTRNVKPLKSKRPKK